MSHALFKLIEGQRAVIHCGGQPETEFHQVALAGHIALEHAANLWDRDVRLVNDGEKILWEVIQQRCRCGAGRTAIDVAGVVLDAGAKTYLLDHF